MAKRHRKPAIRWRRVFQAFRRGAGADRGEVPFSKPSCYLLTKTETPHNVPFGTWMFLNERACSGRLSEETARDAIARGGVEQQWIRFIERISFPRLEMRVIALRVFRIFERA
jgi:hypothetical protein